MPLERGADQTKVKNGAEKASPRASIKIEIKKGRGQKDKGE